MSAVSPSFDPARRGAPAPREAAAASVARLGGLVSLSTTLLPLVRYAPLSRVGRLYPWMIAIGYAGLFALSRSREDIQPAAVVASALAIMSWAAGAVAWAASRDTVRDDRAEGLVALVAARGRSPGELRLAHALSTMRVVARAVGLPGVCVAVLSGIWASGAHRVREVLILAPCVVAYAVGLGVVLGGLARLSALVSPRQGRILFAVVVLGPWLLQRGSGSAPSVVGGFSILLDHMAALGAAPG